MLHRTLSLDALSTVKALWASVRTAAQPQSYPAARRGGFNGLLRDLLRRLRGAVLRGLRAVGPRGGAGHRVFRPCAHGPWPLVVYYYIITPLCYIIILLLITTEQCYHIFPASADRSEGKHIKNKICIIF